MRDFINIVESAEQNASNLLEGYWGEVQRTRIFTINTSSDLVRLMKLANRGKLEYGVDVRGFWFPSTESVIGFSGWNLTHPDVEHEYPEVRSAVPITFFHDQSNVLGTGRSDRDGERLSQSETLQRIMGGTFEIEDTY